MIKTAKLSSVSTIFGNNPAEKFLFRKSILKIDSLAVFGSY